MYFVIASLVIFAITAFYVAETRLNETLAETTATSSTAESGSNLFITIIMFLPSGALLAYPYIRNNFQEHKTLRYFILSFCLALVFTIPFWWYNFSINFAR